MRRGQIVTWILGGVGALITTISLTYGIASGSYRDQINTVATRQAAFDEAIIKLTEIETQNATLIKVYGEQIKELQTKK